MASREITLRVNARQAMKDHAVMRVQYIGTFRVKVGFFIMKIGAWIAGVQVVDEFPMSLIQPEADHERNR